MHLETSGATHNAAILFAIFILPARNNIVDWISNMLLRAYKLSVLFGQDLYFCPEILVGPIKHSFH